MFSLIMIPQLIPCTEALECEAGKNEIDGKCCPPCHAGFRLNKSCNIWRPTMCVLCSPGTYTTQQNVMKECLQCKVCDPEFGLVTKRECSSTSNTVCSCSPGYFCADMKDDNCDMCVASPNLQPWSYVKSRGTEKNNTICEKCPAGTFSHNGTHHYCLPWTNCTAQGLFEEKPGMDTTDAVCSPQSNPQHIKYKSTIIIPIIIIAIIAIIYVKPYVMVKLPDFTAPESVERFNLMTFLREIWDSSKSFLLSLLHLGSTTGTGTGIGTGRG
ncbi:tumor necrosis factor receptor superfamily member 14-like [Dromiciops gliroides]|uniref:tumor necrosis factor receptor superfamily member 14-like n=1 Tax=Dromiciops gliroides TaxID=33562 RepID=UPI001CC79C65|nr:tumor necrosis factor receptor superfamily member 14-like [Dromiciops gliroides]